MRILLKHPNNFLNDAAGSGSTQLSLVLLFMKIGEEKGGEGSGGDGREEGEGKGWGRHSISCLRAPQT